MIDIELDAIDIEDDMNIKKKFDLLRPSSLSSLEEEYEDEEQDQYL
jgi:hypothetical protein